MYLDNENIKKKEKEVSLIELFWEVLTRWRLVIVLTMFCTVLVGGYKLVSNMQNYKKVQNSTDMSVKELNEFLTDNEKNTVMEAREKQIAIKKKQEYLNESELMRIDAYNKNVEVMQYYIKGDRAEDLVVSYLSYFKNGGPLKELNKKLHWQKSNKYLLELFSAEQGEQNKKDNGLTDEANIFTVYVTGKNRNSCENNADAIKQVALNYRKVLERKIGPHELILLNSNTKVIKDDSLIDKQDDLKGSIITLKTELNTLKSNMTEQQLKLLELENSDAEIQQNRKENENKVFISKKFVFMGFLLGFLLSVLWISIRYIFNGNIKTRAEVQNLFGLNLYGEIKKLDAQKKHFMIIDHKISAWKEKATLSNYEIFEFICSKLRADLEQNNISELLLTTSLNLNKKEQTIIKQLVSEISASNIRVSMCGDITNNIEAFNQLIEIGNVLFIEKFRETKYTTIEKELEICNNYSINVLGSIMFH